MDFRNVLKKTTGPERKVYKSGGAVQTDFRGSLKKPSKVRREKEMGARDGANWIGGNILEIFLIYILTDS